MHVCTDAHLRRLSVLLARYGLTLIPVLAPAPIPGSYWGAPEAGLEGHSIHVRSDTPVHSVLHEAAHVICMDAARRARLDTDAGGDYAEENAVCYLQIVLAAYIGLTGTQLCTDMDTWGYTFRLGSAHAWFTQDAGEAREWLERHGLFTAAGEPTWQLRGAA
jgi:hypothetical protein